MKPTRAVLDLYEVSHINMTVGHLPITHPAALSGGGALDCGTEITLHTQQFIFSLKTSIAFCSSSLTLRLFLGMTQIL